MRCPDWNYRIERAGWYVKPAVELDYTQYSLNNTSPGQDDKPDRVLPISSFDAGVVLERKTARSGLIQTLEPRLLFAHIPHENQDGLPVFDTIEAGHQSGATVSPQSFPGASTGLVKPISSVSVSHREFWICRAAAS